MPHYSHLKWRIQEAGSLESVFFHVLFSSSLWARSQNGPLSDSLLGSILEEVTIVEFQTDINLKLIKTMRYENTVAIAETCVSQVNWNIERGLIADFVSNLLTKYVIFASSRSDDFTFSLINPSLRSSSSFLQSFISLVRDWPTYDIWEQDCRARDPERTKNCI